MWQCAFSTFLGAGMLLPPVLAVAPIALAFVLFWWTPQPAAKLAPSAVLAGAPLFRAFAGRPEK